jgi:lysophospholipase L1-like esterase
MPASWKFLSGPSLASRPAAAAENVGWVYKDESTELFWESNGVTWVPSSYGRGGVTRETDIQAQRRGHARWIEKQNESRLGSGISADIVVIGDSMSDGTGADWYENWVHEFRRLIQGPNFGTNGYMPAAYVDGILDANWPGGDSPWTFGGAVTANTGYGFGNAVNVPSGGGSATYSWFGESIYISHVRNAGGPTACAVTLDGVAQTALDGQDATETTNVLTKYTANYGFHTIVLTPNNGTLILEGAIHDDGDVFAGLFPVRTVRVYHLARGGQTTQIARDTMSTWAPFFTGRTGVLGHVVIELGANDEAFNFTIEENIKALIAGIDAAVGSTLHGYTLMIAPTTDLNTVATMNSIADAYPDRVDVLDLGAMLPGRVLPATMRADSVHPNKLGMLWIASQLRRHLDAAPAVLPSFPNGTHKKIVAGSDIPAYRNNWAESWAANAAGGYDVSPGGAAVSELIYRVWLDAGTYRLTPTFEHHAGGPTTAEVLLGKTAEVTPALVSAGTVNTSVGAAVTPTRLGTTVVNGVPGWYPVVIRKPATATTLRFVNLRIERTA